MATFGTRYTRNLSKEPLTLTTPVVARGDDSVQSPRSKELCGTCGSIDFSNLVRTHQKQPLGSIRQAYRNWWCPLCSMITEQLAKVNPQLDAYKDIVESDLNYSIRFAGDVAGSGMYQDTLLVALESPSDTRFGSSQWYNAAALDLVGPLKDRSTDTSIAVGKRRPVRTCLEVTELKSWLSTCDHCHTTHMLERTTSEADIQTEFMHLQQRNRFRLIDVRANKVVTLRETPRYFALSYIWGKTMASYHASNLLDIERFDSLPQTVRDAMFLVQRLGERYLWVDTLCIDQNVISEKQDVVAHMGPIYRNAYATIVAASAQDSSVGISALYPSSSRTETVVKMKSDQLSSFRLLASRPRLEDLVERSPWSTRAWTFQERLLSRRCIFFFDDEVVLQCANGILREAYDLGHKHTSSSKQDLFHQSMELTPFGWPHYCSAVGDYSHRNMTVAGDRFDAFRGIFERFCAHNNSKEINLMLSGLPLEWFGTALLWTPPAGHPFPKRNLHDAPEATILPSWSWVGWTGVVDHVGAKMPEPPYISMDLWNLESVDRKHLLLHRKSDKNVDVLRRSSLTSPNADLSRSTILHIYVPVVDCFLDVSTWDEDNIASLVVASPSETGESAIEIAIVMTNDRFWVAQQEEGKRYKVLLFIDANSFMKKLIPVLLVDPSNDTWVERVPVAAHATASFETLAKFSKVEHVQIR